MKEFARIPLSYLERKFPIGQRSVCRLIKTRILEETEKKTKYTLFKRKMVQTLIFGSWIEITHSGILVSSSNHYFFGNSTSYRISRTPTFNRVWFYGFKFKKKTGR